MNHLDEGTIHAWLDGALDARQAADAQAHVDACAACSARLAEARGFIAASSRILMALDDVPANVTPKRAPTAAPKLRRWAASPWVTGIAAVLVLVALWRTSDLDRSTNRTKVSIPDISIPPVTVLESTQPALTPVPPAAPATPARQLANAPVAAGAGAGGAGAASAPASASPAVAELARAERRDEARFAGKDAAADARASWEGCYRIDATAKLAATADVATTSVAAERAMNRARRAAPSAQSAAGAAAPTAAQKSSVDAPAALSVIRLDTIARDPGFAVRWAGARRDSTIGVWRELSADSVRVELPARGIFTLAKRDRVACPQPE